jgi:hypothetical protein
MDEILTLVQDSLSGTSAVPTGAADALKDEDAEGEIVGDMSYSDTEAIGEEWEDSGMMEFVDTEGAFEGDLDAEEIDE